MVRVLIIRHFLSAISVVVVIVRLDKRILREFSVATIT
jgi:hypothetical protein